MTIAVGFRCSNGMVIATDSQYSLDISKTCRDGSRSGRPDFLRTGGQPLNRRGIRTEDNRDQPILTTVWPSGLAHERSFGTLLASDAA
jgi:hypothetical protein